MPEFIRAPKSNRFVSSEPLASETKSRKHKPKVVVSSEMPTGLEEYALNPLAFALDTFQWGRRDSFLANFAKPLDWQFETLEEISASLQDDPTVCRVAIASGKGIGKTGLLALLFLWHVSTHRHSQTTITSVTGRQSSDKCWREVKKWRHVWNYRDDFPVQSSRLVNYADDTWFGVHQTWAIDKPEAFQGSHEQHVGFLVDEASGIPDTILETIETGLTDSNVFIAYFSNPTRTSGRFRECFRGIRAQHWLSRNIDSRDVPIVSKERIQEQLDECNGDIEASSFRRNVRGLFPLEDYDQVIPQWILDMACERRYEHTNTARITIGADIARKGANKTVFVVRQDYQILEVLTYSKQEIDQSADRLMELMDKYRKEPNASSTLPRQHNPYPQTFCDGDGLGIGVVDLCNREGYRVTAVHSATPALADDRYANKRAEMWYHCREWLRKDAALDVTAWYYSLLQAQLIDVFFYHDSQNRILIESKEDMLARGVASPDMADALVYSLGLVQPRTRVAFVS